ncbi:MAG: GntR family transcriptional regulator [Pseudomonadota bacterium]
MTDPTALPKYVQTAEMLIREIAAGRLVAGERLPPEREMAKDLGLAVGTLRKALADLEDRGLLERVQGSGNYVRPGAEGAGIYAFFRLELVAGGGLPTAEILSVDRLSKPADLPQFGTSAQGHRIRRLRRLGGQPAALEEIWLDASYTERVSPEDLSESLYLFYRQRLGLWITRVRDDVGVDTVPVWRTDCFGLPAGAPCGYVERLSWGQDGDRPEFSRTWFDHTCTRYVARLK